MVSAVLAIVLVNVAHKLLMRVLGVSVMFFDLKKKIMWYVVVWLILISFLGI